ncbi:unnamed protein product, partial [Didymodactylos carnosus]
PEHPNFTIAAIESSCREPSGWCYTTLQTKANALTRGINSTSVRIRIGNMTFLEIWPPNHKSTVIQHSLSTHGIIRILSNQVMIEFHPYISANPQQKPFLARLCEENDVTYFKPGLNQIYRFFNPRNTLAIIIQAFDRVAFEYIGSDQKQIKQQSEVSTDIEYEKFKKLIEKDYFAAVTTTTSSTTTTTTITVSQLITASTESSSATTTAPGELDCDAHIVIILKRLLLARI